MENELLQLWSTTRASVVFVTHDLEEAIALADRVVVITAGPGTVKGVYRVDLPRPRNVAEIRFQPVILPFTICIALPRRPPTTSISNTP